MTAAGWAGTVGVVGLCALMMKGLWKLPALIRRKNADRGQRRYIAGDYMKTHRH